MNDNVIQLGARRTKASATPGQSPVKSEGPILMDQDPAFNHDLQNCTVTHILKLSECKNAEDVDAFVRAGAALWRESLQKSPEYLELLSIEASVEFPGEDNLPTAELFRFDHRVRTAIAAALSDDSEVELRDKLLSTLSSFSMTVRMWMFANAAGSNNQLAYGGKMGIQLDMSYFGVGITLFIDNAIQANTFFAKKILPT